MRAPVHWLVPPHVPSSRRTCPVCCMKRNPPEWCKHSCGLLHHVLSRNEMMVAGHAAGCALVPRPLKHTAAPAAGARRLPGGGAGRGRACPRRPGQGGPCRGHPGWGDSSRRGVPGLARAAAGAAGGGRRDAGHAAELPQQRARAAAAAQRSGVQKSLFIVSTVTPT